ncbi:serine/threonine protein kinase [Sphaerisporangium sp. NBC_01403]|uniref:serine/threonine-protein kinase n=1 Tax=Sphaerisporangium sp. NBC_01403 TaxID=2903599 RepID=UPI003250D7AB
MQVLHLGGEWELGERIGGGGFGAVYVAKSTRGEAVAKLVPKEPGAEREMLFVDLPNAVNVIPIIDSGQTATHWALVMPRADKSLRQYIAERQANFEVAEVITIVSDVAEALSSIEGAVVHRDIKPENILLYRGRWCLADFGISRYAEAATSTGTRKNAMSPPYAAPERWKYERAQISTDVYSLGVIAYELVSGSLPFNGPTWDQFREQHLRVDVPPLKGVPSGIAAIIDECLYKAPGARPGPRNLLMRLQKMATLRPEGGLAKLQEANRAEVMRIAQSVRRESELQSETERREVLAQVAARSLLRIMDAFRESVADVAPAARIAESPDGGWAVALNRATLSFSGFRSTPMHPWGGRKEPAFDVIAHAFLTVSAPPNAQGYGGRSHSLWYCDAKESGQYQWYETAFMAGILAGNRRLSDMDPFSLVPGELSAGALVPGTDAYQVAWPFSQLSLDDCDEFMSRWAGWLAAASEEQLQHPSRMPEREPQGSWRQS